MNVPYVPTPLQAGDAGALGHSHDVHATANHADIVPTPGIEPGLIRCRMADHLSADDGTLTTVSTRPTHYTNQPRLVSSPLIHYTEPMAPPPPQYRLSRLQP